MEKWVYADYTDYRERNQALKDLIKESKGNGIKYFIVEKEEKKWVNGEYKTVRETLEQRLFIGMHGDVGYFKGRQTRNGYMFDVYNTISVTPKVIRPRKTEEQKRSDRLHTVLKYLNTYGLWKNFNFSARLYLACGMELSKKAYDRHWAYIREQSGGETDQEYYNYVKDFCDKEERIAKRIIEKVSKCSDEEVKNKLAEVLNKRITIKEEHKYIHIPKELENRFSYSDIIRCFSEFEMLTTHPIKTMTFHKDRYRKWQTEDELKTIKKCMEEKKSYSTHGDNGYDVSFEYNAEKNVAFYNCEYRNCGNGHYYYVLDDRHAIFGEDD